MFLDAVNDKGFDKLLRTESQVMRALDFSNSEGIQF